MTDAAWWVLELLVACGIASWLCWRHRTENLMVDDRPLLERAMEWVREHVGVVASWYSRDRARAAWIAGYRAHQRDIDQLLRASKRRKAGERNDTEARDAPGDGRGGPP